MHCEQLSGKKDWVFKGPFVLGYRDYCIIFFMYIYIYINSSSNYILYFVGLSVIFLINVASFHGMFPLAFSSAESSQRFQSNWKSAILPRICFQKVLLGIDTKAFIRMVGWLDLGPVAQVFIFVEVAM